MKNTMMTLSALAFAAFLAVSPQALAQDLPGAPPAAPEAGAQQEEQTFEGELVNVNAETSTLTARNAAGQEMQFSYSPTTEVVGEVENVQGLSGQAGSQLRIQYRSLGATHMATQIEVVEE